MRPRTAVALAGIAGTLTLGTAAPAAAQPTRASWAADLPSGEAAGVEIIDGTVRLTPDGAFLAVADDAQPGGSAGTGPLPTGLLTFAPRRLATPTDRITAVLDADVPPGAFVTVDVRARRGSGAWTEWFPATADAGGPTVALPAPSTEVQGRLVLTGDPAAGPVVRGVRLTANTAQGLRQLGEDVDQAPLSFHVFATREGLVGGTTANGHIINPRDHFAALPSRRALAPRGTGDYSVRVCAPDGRCAVAPVWDVGPWNTRDDYWNPPSQRQQWADLPQGLPQAQAAHLDGYNGGRDQYNRPVVNPAGIDLGDGLFWDALGLTDNAWLTVEYLWTGSAPLASVSGDSDILAAPSAAAAVVGTVADRATVPVQCLLTAGADRWLQIGVGQFLSAVAVPELTDAPSCPHGDP